MKLKITGNLAALIRKIVIRYSRLNCGILILVGWLYSVAAYADDDQLAGIKGAVASNFGTGSTFIHLLYVVEIISAIWAYVRQKNPAAVTGILVISIFGTYALGHWGLSS